MLVGDASPSSPLDPPLLAALDLVINVKKSCCMRIGQRSNVMRYFSGAFLPWAAFFYCLGPLQSGPVWYQAVLFLRPSDSLRVL